MRHPLPTHPRLLHPFTGRPLVAVGVRNDGRPIMPIMGASEAKAAAETPEAKAAAENAATAAAAKTAADKAAEDKSADKGYPADTAVADMKPEEQLAYWKFQAKKHETAWKGKAGDLTPETVAALQKRIADMDAANLTDTEKALAEAKEAGRAEALAESGTKTIQTLIDARVVAVGLDKTKDVDTIETVNALDFTKFIDENNSVDAVRLMKVLDRLVPLKGVGNNSSWPATGQGNRNTGAASAKDAGKSEAARRFGTEK